MAFRRKVLLLLGFILFFYDFFSCFLILTDLGRGWELLRSGFRAAGKTFLERFWRAAELFLGRAIRKWTTIFRRGRTRFWEICAVEAILGKRVPECLHKWMVIKLFADEIT